MIGNILLAAGVLSLLLAGVAYYTDLMGGDRVLPRPVALAGGNGVERASVGSPTATETATPAPTATATVLPTRTPLPMPTPTPIVPEVPILVVIPSIGVESPVKEAGTYWYDKQLYYETLPFVVAHYRMTAKAGEKGNAVFSGHVTSRNAGNVFADLYKVQLGDEVHFYSENHEYSYVVTNIRLVDPTDVSVMNPTPDATATLITCAGEWIPAERQYSQRLVVTAKLKR